MFAVFAKTRSTSHSNVCHLALLLLLSVTLTACSSSDDDDDDSQFEDDSTPIRPIINRDNYTDLLSQVFRVYVGDTYSQPLVDISEFNITGRNPDGSFLGVFDCETGSFEQNLDPTTTNAGVFFTFDFNECEESGAVHNGAIGGQNGGRGLVFETGQYSVRTHPDLFSMFFGHAQLFYSQTGFFDDIHSWDTTGFSLQSRTIDGDLTLDEMTSSFAYGRAQSGLFSAWLRGGFTMRADVTGGSPVSVSTPVEFSHELNTLTDSGTTGDDGVPMNPEKLPLETINDWNFTTGKLDLLAEDGSMLTLDADTGNPDTVTISIRSGTGVADSADADLASGMDSANNVSENSNLDDNGTDTFEAPWSQWQNILRFQAYPAESPDWTSAGSRADPDLNAGPAITRENYAAILDLLFDLYAGRGYLEALALSQQLLGETQPTETWRDRGVRTDHFACDNDGVATALRVDADSSAYHRPYRLRLDNCAKDGYQFDGEIQGIEPGNSAGIHSQNSRQLGWVDPAGQETRFIGDTTVSQTSSDKQVLCKLETDSPNILALPGDAAAVIGADRSGYRTLFEITEDRDGRLELTLDGPIALTSAVSGKHWLSVNTSQLKAIRIAGASEEDWHFTQGQLSVLADDGSYLELVDDGAPEGTAQPAFGRTIRVRNNDGELVIEQPWTTWRSRFAAARSMICAQ